MDKVKPVTPYVASSYLDKEEETWLKGVASQGVWAAVNAQEKKTVSGGKSLAMPVPQEPNPPDKYNDGVSTWWDIFDGDWWKSDEPWPPPFGPKWIPPKMSTAMPTSTLTSTPVLVTQTPTKTLHPDVATIIALQTANTPLPTRTPLPTPTFSPTLFDYGIETVGLDQQHKEIVFNAANLTGTKLIPYISEARGIPDMAFRIAMGEVTIMIDKDADIDDHDGICLTTSNSPLSLIQQVIFKHPYLTTYDQKIDGQTVKVPAYVNTPQTIVCTEPPDEATLIHEFQHVLINMQTSAKNINVFELVQQIQMSDGRMLDSENGYWIRQGLGFLKGENSWEHSPVSEEERTNGVGKNEHSADMFLNFVYDGTGNPNYGFTNDSYGDARRQEEDKFLETIFGPKQ